MRTIKFRGRHLCGQWYYGNLIVRETDSPVPETPQAYKCVMIGDVEDGSAEEVEENTIGQFTGLQDCKGNDIYEGDIIYCEFGDGSNIKMLIGWNENEACFGLMDEYNYRSKLKGYAFPKFDNDVLFNFRDAERFEIVGNVFDNSDLLH